MKNGAADYVPAGDFLQRLSELREAEGGLRARSQCPL